MTMLMMVVVMMMTIMMMRATTTMMMVVVVVVMMAVLIFLIVIAMKASITMPYYCGSIYLSPGVALLPFVEEKRLLDALAVVYPDLTQDESTSTSLNLNQFLRFFFLGCTAEISFFAVRSLASFGSMIVAQNGESKCGIHSSYSRS